MASLGFCLELPAATGHLSAYHFSGFISFQPMSISETPPRPPKPCVSAVSSGCRWQNCRDVGDGGLERVCLPPWTGAVFSGMCVLIAGVGRRLGVYVRFVLMERVQFMLGVCGRCAGGVYACCACGTADVWEVQFRYVYRFAVCAGCVWVVMCAGFLSWGLCVVCALRALPLCVSDVCLLLCMRVCCVCIHDVCWPCVCM